ncbi:hypothetical protein BDW62DRAFT_211990 [Aspergillus aurantiobrunneus]
MDVHVVSKSDNRHHATFQIPIPANPLNPSSVRLRPSLISLASNNLSYARGGTRLHWWDAYPVPSTSPAPYNNQAEWGIVPAWGLATVLDSTIADIPTGTTLFGFWPASGHAIDLQLAPAETPGHWVEVSAHRRSLMPLYNRYAVFDTAGKDLIEFGWDVAVRPIMLAGYVLSEYIFTPDPVSRPPVHPFTDVEEWTVEDADLTKTVFVSLAASTKTARAAAYNFFCRPRGSGPLGFLQVTSSPGAILEAAEKFIPEFPVKALAYGDVDRAGEWISAMRPQRIVIADFGARDGGLDGIIRGIEGTTELQGVQVMVLAVGSQQKVYTPDELQRQQASFTSMKKVGMNTSTVQETAIQVRGLEVFSEELRKRWEHWLANRECAAPDLRLVWGQGVTREQGIEGGWESLCRSNVRPEEALIYRIPG